MKDLVLDDIGEDYANLFGTFTQEKRDRLAAAAAASRAAAERAFCKNALGRNTPKCKAAAAAAAEKSTAATEIVRDKVEGILVKTPLVGIENPKTPPKGFGRMEGLGKENLNLSDFSIKKPSLVGLELLNPPKENLTLVNQDSYEKYAKSLEEERIKKQKAEEKPQKPQKEESIFQENLSPDSQLIAIAQEKEAKFKKIIMYGGIGVGVVILGIITLSMFRRKQA